MINEMIKKLNQTWPKGPTQWIDSRTLYISIPFTWNLPSVKSQISQSSFFWDKVVVGGPAVALIPDFFNDLEFVSVGSQGLPDVLQRINPLATKTTIGCPRRCAFCAVPYTEPAFQELDDWPDLPILIDNNLLASSQKHFDKVIDRLVKLGWADFNQGLDARLLTWYHAKRLSEIKKPLVRLALDSCSMRQREAWTVALKMLLSAGIAKTNIRSYALIGFDSGPFEAWDRCQWIEGHGVKVLPMWFHPLDAMDHNRVTEDQEVLGWTDLERKRIMQWYFQHNEKKYGGSIYNLKSGREND